MARRYALGDDQWEQISGGIAGEGRYGGATAHDNRLFVEAVRYRTSVPWPDLPERFDDLKNIHRRHRRWAESGVWENVFNHLAQDVDNKDAMIDSAIVELINIPSEQGGLKKGLESRRERGDRTLKSQSAHENPRHM